MKPSPCLVYDLVDLVWIFYSRLLCSKPGHFFQIHLPHFELSSLTLHVNVSGFTGGPYHFHCHVNFLRHLQRKTVNTTLRSNKPWNSTIWHWEKHEWLHQKLLLYLLMSMHILTLSSLDTRTLVFSFEVHCPSFCFFHSSDFRTKGH